MTTGTLSSFLTGFSLSAALIVAIGAQNLFVLRQGLRREHVGPVVLFCGGVDALLVVVGVAGVGGFLATLPQLARLLAAGGAAFLCWHGVAALRRMAAPGALIAAAAGGTTLGRALAAAAGFTLLNPHVYFDTVLLMGAAGAAEPAGTRPFFVAGAAAASGGWFAALGYGARHLAPLFARPAAWRLLDGLVAATMLGLAATLMLRALA